MIALFKRGLIYLIIGYCMGLIAWGISLSFSAHIGLEKELWWLVSIMTIFGMLTGGSVGIAELVAESPRKLRAFFGNFHWFFIGAFFGMAGGFLGALAGHAVFIELTGRIRHPWFGRTCGMFIVGLVLGLFIGLVEKLRTGSWERFSSVVIAGACGGAITGALRQALAQHIEQIDTLALLLVVFGSLMVAIIAIVTSLRTTAVLRGHPDNIKNVTVKYGPGFELPLAADSSTVVGSGFSDRISAKTGFRIYNDDLVDSIQAVITFSDDGWYLSPPPEYPDMGEHTYINQVKVTAPTRLQDGDFITFGKTIFRFSAAGGHQSRGNHGLTALLCAALLGWSGARSPVRAQEPLPAAAGTSWALECLDEVVDMSEFPQLTIRFRTIKPQTSQDSLEAIEPMRNASAWGVADERGDPLGMVQSVQPLAQTAAYLPSLSLIVAVDCSVPSAGYDYAQARVSKNPSPVRDLVKFFNAQQAPVKLAVIPFASIVPKASDMRLLPAADPDMGTQIDSVPRFLDRKENCYCTAILPMLRRCLEALYRDNPNPAAVRALFVVSDGMHDLFEKTALYDCTAYGLQNFSDEERSGERVTAYLNGQPAYIFFFGTKRMDVERAGKDRPLLSPLMIFSRTKEGEKPLSIPQPYGYECIMPPGREAELLQSGAEMLLKRMAAAKVGAQASRWELRFEAGERYRSGLLAFPAMYLLYNGSKIKVPCLTQFSFMAVTAETDTEELRRRLLTALGLILALWVAIGILYYVNYLMEKNLRARTELAGVAAAPTGGPSQPAPVVRPQGDSRGGYALPKADDKPKPPPAAGEPPAEPPGRPAAPPPAPFRPDLDEAAIPEISDDSFPDDSRLSI